MDIIEQLESKIRSSLNQFEQLKLKVLVLEEENQKLKKTEKERTEKLERLLKSIDDTSEKKDDVISEEQAEIVGESRNAETIDEGEDIF